MSYSFTVKRALLNTTAPRCCKMAELQGFLCFCTATEHKQIIDRYFPILKKVYPSVDVQESGNRRRKYILKVPDEYCERIDFSVLRNDCCPAAFLRGAFIGGGFLSDPENTYRAEIVVRRPGLADDLIRIFSKIGITPHKSRRRENTVVYIKSADDIKVFLSAIGAKEYVFDYINAEIEKNIRNDINRFMNCENANLNKMVLASERQAGAAEKLKAAGYPNVPDSLIELAELRLQNRELTLGQLGALLSPPLSKAGVCHRMKKIVELSEKI